MNKMKNYKNMTTKELWGEILKTIMEIEEKFTEKDKELFTELILTWKKKHVEDELKKAGISANVKVINKNG